MRRWWQEPRGEVRHSSSHKFWSCSRHQPVLLHLYRDERSSEEEASDEGATPTWGQHLQRHGDLEHRDIASLGCHVCLQSPRCPITIAACVFIFVCGFVCVGRERGASGNCGGRDFLPVSGGECGVSPSATSLTSQEVSQRQPLVTGCRTVQDGWMIFRMDGCHSGWMDDDQAGWRMFGMEVLPTCFSWLMFCFFYQSCTRSSCLEPKRSGGATARPARSMTARKVWQHHGQTNITRMILNMLCLLYKPCLWQTESPVWTWSNWTFLERSHLSSSSRR